MINEKVENYNKFQLSITLILILSFCITGTTYAYYYLTETNTNTITGSTATVNLTLDVQKIFPAKDSDNTGVLVPQLSTSGSGTSPLATALKSGCIDDNNNVVCQVYKIDVKNDGGTAIQVADGWISFYSDNTLTTDVSIDIPNLKWKLITSADENTPANSVLGENEDLEANYNKNIFADDITMPTNESYTYYIIVWLNETRELQETDAGKTYYGKIEFKSANGTGVTSTFTP